MTQASLRQHFYSQLTEHYLQGELQAMYHWCIDELHGWSRVEAYSHNDDVVSGVDLNRWTEVVERLKKMEPLQYIFCKAQFRNFELFVNDAVLIPRPETEELVQLVLDRENSDTLQVLDVGAGSGCIALALKMVNPQWIVSGCDISKDALEVANKNRLSLNLEVSFFEADVRDEMDVSRFNVIVSNPPYIPPSLEFTLESNVLEFEPHLALFSPESDPFYFFKRITALAASSSVHSVYFETHATEMNDLVSELSAIWKGSIECVKDLSGKERFLKLS